MALPTSRGFLLLLLLATVTCIVVVQISMDGWILSMPYDIQHIVERKQNHEALVSHHPSFMQSTRMRIGTTPIPNTTTKILIPNTTTAKSLTMDSKTHKIAVTNTPKISPKTVMKKVVEYKDLTSSAKKVPVLGNFTQSIQVKMKTGRVKPNRSFGVDHPLSIDKKLRSKKKILHNSNNLLLRVRSRNSSLEAVKKLPVVNPQNVTNVFLITYFRSGSSFIGELLQQNWKTFYQFEPLHYMTYDSRISENRTAEAFNLFRSIYTCNFTNLDTYFDWVRRSRNQFLFSRSLFLWFYCRTEPRMCFVPNFVSAVCERAPVRLTKVTRIQMRQLKNFLTENNDLKFKVIYLTRDPRGILSSRWSLDWCNGTDCSDPNFLCEEMSDDISVFEEMAKQDPNGFIRVRYEDLALNPMEEASRLFKFLNIPFPRSIKRFLKSHTTARKGDIMDPYSTRRNSSSVVLSWKQRLRYNEIKAVQDSCYNVLDKLNYSLILSPDELSYEQQTSSILSTSESNSEVSEKFSQSATKPHVLSSPKNSNLSSSKVKSSKVLSNKENLFDSTRKNLLKSSSEAYQPLRDVTDTLSDNVK